MSGLTPNIGLNEAALSAQRALQHASGADFREPLRVAVAVIKNAQGQVLISFRSKAQHQGGLWEFPGGKLEAAETPLQALIREIKEELDIVVNAASPLITINHCYSDLAVQLLVYQVDDFSGAAKGCQGQAIQWAALSDLPYYAFPEANRPIITAAQLPPFYALLDDADESLLLTNLEKILQQGVKLIQARLKRLPANSVKTFIDRAGGLCQRYGAALVMNSAVKRPDGLTYNRDDIWVAERLGLAGIHLTSADLLARTKRPEGIRWCSASCHNLPELQHAEKIGVDFAVLAPVQATQTHQAAQAIGWHQFEHWVASVNMPVYALGGMSKADLTTARQAGGQGIAAISAFL